MKKKKKMKYEDLGRRPLPPRPLKKSPEQIIAYIVRQMCAFFFKLLLWLRNTVGSSVNCLNVTSLN